MTPRKPARKPAPKKKPAKASASRGGRAATKKVASAAAKKKADAAAARVRAAGASGKRASGPMGGLRDSMIVARHAQGVPWASIAAEAGITVRQCQRVVEAQRAIRSPLEESPMELLEGLARGFARSIADFEAMAHGWAETNQSASLGAKKAADETRARLATLMADVGKLPSNLELFRSEMEMKRIAEAMKDYLVGVRDGDYTADQAIDFFRSLVTRHETPGLPVPS